MNDKIEKANFHLDTGEYEKAEKLFSEAFDGESSNIDAIIGLMISKIYEGNLKGAEAYYDKIPIEDLERDKHDDFRNRILDSAEHYIEDYLDDLREKANNLSKRPAMEGQLYSIKEFGDTTDHMDNINNSAKDFEKILDIAKIAYEIERHDKEQVAFAILNLYDKVFQSIRSTPKMQGKTLLDSKELEPLKNRREEWKNKAGEKGASKVDNPSDSSGCLVVIIAISMILSVALIQI